MSAGNDTTTPTEASVPSVAPGFRLQYEPAQDAQVLLFPEGMVKLNQSGGEIMKRCDGKHTIAEIAAELERAFSTSGLIQDVLGFVRMAGEKRWLRWE